MSQAQEKTRIEIRILVAGVSPETVSVGDLVDLLSHYEKAVLEAAGGFGEQAQGEPLISLVSIGPGSERLTLGFPAASSPRPSP